MKRHRYSNSPLKNALALLLDVGAVLKISVNALEIALDALQRIRDFSHHSDCTSSAPVHECGCFDDDERTIARKALERIDRDAAHAGTKEGQ